VWHAWEHPDGTWTGWQPLGLPGGQAPGPDSPVAVSVMPRATDGRLDAFIATDRYQTVWHRWQIHSGTGPWSRWNSLAEFDGPIESGPSAIGLSDGRFAAFVVADGKVWHSSQTQADDEQWPPWSAFGKPNGQRSIPFPLPRAAANPFRPVASGHINGLRARPDHLRRHHPQSGVRTCIFEWLGPVNGRPAWKDLPPSATATSGVGRAGRRIHFLHNWSWTATQAAAPCPLEDVLTGARFDTGEPVALRSWDVRILAEAQPSDGERD
jgi:hypothetical protein